MEFKKNIEKDMDKSILKTLKEINKNLNAIRELIPAMQAQCNLVSYLMLSKNKDAE